MSLPVPPTPSSAQPGPLTLALAFLLRLPSWLLLGFTCRLAGLLVMGLCPVSSAGWLKIVAPPFQAVPVREAWPSPRLHHVHLPAPGCPHLLPVCEPWTAFPSRQWLLGCCADTQPPSPHGPGTYTQFHFTCGVAPVFPFGTHVPGVMLTLLAGGPRGTPAAGRCQPPHKCTAGNMCKQCLPGLLKGSSRACPELHVVVESVFAVSFEIFWEGQDELCWAWWQALSALPSAQGRGEVHVFLSPLGC